ncbi:MAG: glycyl-radical enzyme activating protein [Ignavibacteriales bacterium]|nr:glycyl-radical enzyme activating protein [Ignavibacteriales bacterium]
MKGLVFNIQRFSVNDGPGIRTTVFLKGCPLHCSWCHNPESIAPDQQLFLRNDRCIRCGECLVLCKNDAIRRVDGGFSTTRDLCVECGECIEACNAEAREIVGKEMSEFDVMKEVEKDVIFYEQSGGGASFSGGEPMLQHEFLHSLLGACKLKGIHTVVDTTGFTSPEILQRLSPLVDLFLYDLKTLDDQKHREYVGVPNRLILSNLKRLAEWGKDVIVRIPIIPGVNDDPVSIRESGVFIASLGNVSEVNLLPYHASGVEKYKRLGTDDEMLQTVPPSADDLSLIVKELHRYVPTVSIGG